MPSTYTSNNKIQKITTGEQSGTWGTTTNTNFDLFDTAIDGFVAVAITGTTHTLNIPDGSAADGRNKVLSFTGALTATNTISVTPNTVKKHYFVQNNTSGSQNIIIYQGSGSTVTIKPGYSSVVYLDGAGGSASAKEVLTSLKLTALLEATGVVFVGSTSGSTTLQPTAIASGTLTMPAATDTLVGKATTDTFTNKTLDTAGAGNVLRINGTQVSAVTGTGSVVLATSPSLTTPNIGTPSAGTLTSCTGLPISTGVSGLGSGVATFLATPSSSNLATAVTDETGTGALVFATSPTLATPLLGTPTSGTLTNCTGLPVSTGVSGLGTGVATFLATPSSANLASAVTDETGSGALVFATSPTLATPLLGTPTSGTLTSCTGLPISTGVSGLGSSVATFLATPSSANLAAAVTGETGIGALVFATGPVLVSASLTTSDIGTPSAGVLTNCTGLPISTGVSGLGSSVATFLATPSSANLASAVTDETGTGSLVFATSPTIVTPTVTTSAVIPLVNGGTAVSSTLILQSTSGAGSSDAIVFKTASQSERMRIDTSGNVGIGTVPGNVFSAIYAAPKAIISVSDSNTGAQLSSIGQLVLVNPDQTTGNTAALQFAHVGTNGNIYTNTSIGAVFTGARGTSYSASDLVFTTGPASNGNAERMRITSAGLVGIGTTSPGYKLDVVGTVTGVSSNLRIANTATAAINNTSRLLLAPIDTTETYSPYVEGILETAGNGMGLAFGTRPSSSSLAERMRIDNAGLVGIGTASPAQMLQIGSTSNRGQVQIISSDSQGLIVQTGGGSGGSGAAISFYDADTSYAAKISTSKSASNTASLVFSTANGSATFGERMRIDNAGLVGIGTASPTKQLHVYSSTAAVLIDTGASASANPELQLAAVARQFNVGVGGATFATTALQGAYYLYDATASSYRFVINQAGNVGIGVTSFGTSAANVIGIANGTAPSTSPAGMGQLYVEAGALKYRGSSGTVTTLGPA